MPAGEAVEEIVRFDLPLCLVRAEIRQLIARALPHDLSVLTFHGAQPGLVECKGVGTLEQCAATRPLPFSMLLFQLPWFEKRATPAKVFRSNAMQCGEGRYSESRENVG